MISPTIFATTIGLVMTLPVNDDSPPYRPTRRDWPAECKGKSYCHIQPSYYPNATIDKLLDNVNLVLELNKKPELGPRSGSDPDVAGCTRNRQFLRIFLIKDRLGRIRYVAQTENFIIKLLVEECRSRGRVTGAYDLSTRALEEHRVDCMEKKVMMKLPVLSLNGTRLISMAPKRGFPLSCSAKVIQI